MATKVPESPLAEPKPAGVASDAPPAAEGTADALRWSGAALAGAVEAVLLSMDRPVTGARLAEALVPEHGAKGQSRVREAIDTLNGAYAESGRSFRIEQVAGGWRVMTQPEFSAAVRAFHAARASARLSRAAVETLAVIAYRQPITRAEIEAIRGVACGEVLRTLLERRLAAIVGRAEELGRPMLYGTSRHFLELFGLASLKDLPSAGELIAPLGEPAAEPAKEPEGAGAER